MSDPRGAVCGAGDDVSVGMRRSGKPVSPGTVFVPILFAALYGLTDEIHQLCVPNRTWLRGHAGGLGRARLRRRGCVTRIGAAYQATTGRGAIVRQERTQGVDELNVVHPFRSI